MIEDTAVTGIPWEEILIVSGWTIGLMLAGKIGSGRTMNWNSSPKAMTGCNWPMEVP